MQLRAVIYLLLAMLFFAIQDAFFKKLTQDYAVIQLLLVRMALVVTTLFVAYLLQRKNLKLRTKHWPLMCLRGAMAFGAFTLYYLALQKIPLAEGATILMSAPLFVTALSVPLLKEQVGPHRWAAVCIGFVAVVFMLRPGTGLFQPIMVLPFISAILYSLIPITTRLIDSNESAFTITFYTTTPYLILCIVVSVWLHLFPATPQSNPFYTAIAQPWASITLNAFAIICVTAALFCVSVLLITSAYRLAQASAIASFEYFYLVWAMLVGYAMFGDVPAVITCVAATVIASCGIYITWRERFNKKLVETAI